LRVAFLRFRSTNAKATNAMTAPARPKRAVILTLPLSFDLAFRLDAAARRHGDKPSAVALDFIEQCLDEQDAWDESEAASRAEKRGGCADA
jgi:predicted transcriptional regulator